MTFFLTVLVAGLLFVWLRRRRHTRDRRAGLIIDTPTYSVAPPRRSLDARPGHRL